jgi:hypothetical protein
MSTLIKLQRSICIRFKADFLVCIDGSKVGIALQTLGKTPINALRHMSQGDTNGWYIWAGEEYSESVDFFQPLHIEHLQEIVPELLPYLGLGPGWRVLLAKNYEDIWYDKNLLDI